MSQKHNPSNQYLSNATVRDFNSLKEALGDDWKSVEKFTEVSCARCSILIIKPPVVTVLGKSYHPDCVRCATCAKVIKSEFVLDANSVVKCAQCATTRKVSQVEPEKPICISCKKAILGKGAKLGDNSFHLECINCSLCKGATKSAKIALDKNTRLPVCEACVAKGSKAPPQHQQQQHSTLDEIEKWSKLREKGIITEMEFAAKKKELLEL